MPDIEDLKERYAALGDFLMKEDPDEQTVVEILVQIPEEPVERAKGEQRDWWEVEGGLHPDYHWTWHEVKRLDMVDAFPGDAFMEALRRNRGE